jgi:hypothetical protein
VRHRAPETMTGIGSTKFALAPRRLNLHRSSPYAVETTASDATSAYVCGKEVIPPLRQVDVEVVDLPAVPYWVEQPSLPQDTSAPKLVLDLK